MNHPLFFMVLSGFFGSVMSILVKLGGHVSFVAATFFRFTVVLGLCLCTHHASANPSSILGKAKNRPFLLMRGLFGTVGLCGFHYSLLKLPYAEAITLQYLSPIFTIALGAAFFGQKVQWFHLLSALLSFVGVGLLVCSRSEHSGFGGVTLDHLIAILAVASSGMGFNTIARIKTAAPSLVIMSYLAFFTLVMSATAVINTRPSLPSLFELTILALSGGATFLMQLCLTKAYSMGKTSRVALVSYFNVLYSPFIGIFFFHESIANQGLVGIFILFMGLILPPLLSKRSV